MQARRGLLRAFASSHTSFSRAGVLQARTFSDTHDDFKPQRKAPEESEADDVQAMIAQVSSV